MKPTCLIADSIHESIFEMLGSIGWDIVYKPAITRAELRQMHHGFDGLIIRSKATVDRDLLGENPTIKFVGRAGAGLDNIDVGYLEQKGIKVIHAAEGNRDAVAEHTMALVLGLLRRIPVGDREVRNQIWNREENRGEELTGKTVSIIGYGNMGSAVAQRLSGFGCKVLAYDKYKQGFEDEYCTEATMEDVFNETDILSLHVPLTQETRMMVNNQYIHRFKKGIILLNTARGELGSLKDIAELVSQGKLRAVALDVLENERLTELTVEQLTAFNYLASQTNVIFTPHIAGWTVESHLKINVALVKKIKNLIL